MAQDKEYVTDKGIVCKWACLEVGPGSVLSGRAGGFPRKQFLFCSNVRNIQSVTAALLQSIAWLLAISVWPYFKAGVANPL